MLSNRGPRGVSARLLAGRFDYLRAPNIDPAGAWAALTFIANGIFVVPSSGVLLTRRGLVELFITATAAGGGGGGIPAMADPNNRTAAAGGQAGDWCFRYRLELAPGLYVPVTIGLKGLAGAAGSNDGQNGNATSFGSFLTLAGGLGGLRGIDGTAADRGFNPSNGGSIISGSVAGDNAIHEGNAGGRGHYFSSTVPNPAYDGLANTILGQFYGLANNTGFAAQPGGGAGAGLFGAPGTPNSGAGGRGAAANSVAGAGQDGSDGQLKVEWRVAA
ncbi:MAG: hypothetical protein SFV21_00230 [Rhodospirillaceae bacterium]|nr:hypothetical protein [Rhodospirillaceae bacterium]